jgi:ClpP class serine protease
MNIYKAILSDVWAISPEHASTYLPLVSAVLSGHHPTVQERPQVLSYADVQMAAPSASATVQQKKIAVVNMRGPLTKEDGLCSYGMESMNNMLQHIKNDASVGAVLLEMDTPGGQASYLPVFQNTLKNLGKPVVAYFNSLCASAGYAIASQCTEIYASCSTDQVGSIGTMMSFYDFRERFEKEGVKLHELYATESTEKNLRWRKALEGDYAPLTKELLDPFNKNFQNSVKAMRTITDEKAYQGKTYMASEAVSIGMIDGLKSKEECYQRLVELMETAAASSAPNMQTSNTYTAMSKHLQTVAAFLGYTGIEAKDNHVSMSVEDMEKIGEALARVPQSTANDTPSFDPTAMEERLTAISNSLDTLTASVQSQGESLSGLTGRVSNLEGQPAAPASATPAPSNEDDAPVVPAWADPNNPINKKISEDLK